MKRFYKKGISLFLILLMSFPLCACKSDDSKALTTVKLNEVAHSIFYAPMYVAIEKGYFEDEGIELSLTTGFGADKGGRAERNPSLWYYRACSENAGNLQRVIF